MEALALDSSYVVGFSDGATVGLLTALQRPDLVRGLVHIGQQANPAGLRPEFLEMFKLEAMPQGNDIVTEAHARAMVDASPDSQFLVVPDATHGLPMEQPDLVANTSSTSSRPSEAAKRRRASERFNRIADAAHVRALR